MKKDRITIVGGGISGLASAYYLEKAGFTNIHLIEAGGRLGGVISTKREDGFLIEEGPESFAVQQRAIFELLEDIGMLDEVIKPLTRRFLLGVDGELIAPPQGMVAFVPTDIEALNRSKLFSAAGRRRLLAEAAVPVSTAVEDESLASFISRRFGAEMLERYAGILLAGIHNTDPEKLSMQGSFPQFLRLEQQYGSLTEAAKAILKRTGGKSSSPFMSLKHGLSSLIDGLTAHLSHTTIHYNTRIANISRVFSSYRLFASNRYYDCDQIIFATPVQITVSLLTYLNADVANFADQFHSGSSLVMSFLYDEENIDIPSDTSGFLLSEDMREVVHACTFSSNKWAQRCPEGKVLFRAYIGGDVLPRLEGLKGDDLLNFVLKDLSRFVSFSGKPDRYFSNYWMNARPSYELGHLKKVEALEAEVARLPGISVIGCAYRGVGISACVQRAKVLFGG